MSQLTDLQQDLGISWRGLQADYGDIRSDWRDSIAEHFEREWWSELESEIPKLLNAMEDFDEVCSQAAAALS